MVYITRREYFNAAHKLFNAEWSDAQNLEVFGKCSYPNWHGHNYILYVTVKGNPNSQTGFIVNLSDVSQITKELVINKIDHRNINLDVDFMKNVLPSTENLAIAIWNQLESAIKKLGADLHCIKLCETENNYVEYFGT
jgi:6-pyruvoyltetrahydropterin/6-carboxytetrahydropterin synthase